MRSALFISSLPCAWNSRRPSSAIATPSVEFPPKSAKRPSSAITRRLNSDKAAPEATIGAAAADVTRFDRAQATRVDFGSLPRPWLLPSRRSHERQGSEPMKSHAQLAVVVVLVIAAAGCRGGSPGGG